MYRAATLTLILTIFLLFFTFSCGAGSTSVLPGNNTPISIANYNGTNVISDHTVAKEAVLRKIPVQYINMARTNLHIVYQHTSHGTHVARGMFGLPDYKVGDTTLFAITGDGNPVNGKLDFHDNGLSSYPSGAQDLSSDETGFILTTKNFLNAPENADVNVVMWSWCDITGHNVTGNYLPGMKALIGEYGVGGSNARAASTPVTFIFMTGHAKVGNNTGGQNPKPQAEEIIEFCQTNGQFCLDYWGIESHDMNDNYWEDVGEDSDSAAYGGNFYISWQTNHTLGVDWYENKSAPGGSVAVGDHNSQHITSNRKAYAMWWILARIVGWDGKLE